MAGERVEQPVGPDLGWIIDTDVEAPVEGGACDERFDVEPVTAETAEVVERGRHHGADHRGGEVVAFEASVTEQRHQPDAVFVRSPLCLGAHAPDAAPFVALADGEDDIGVAAVYNEEHRTLHPNRTLAAACAAPTKGAGKMKKNVVNSPVAAATNDSDAGRGSNGAAGASKYITFTMRR